MTFDLDWVPQSETAGSVETSSAEEWTTATISLQVAGTALMRSEDVLTGKVRSHAILPASTLAEWFAWNWWRLLWEPQAPQGVALASQEYRDWFESHNLLAVGGGWLWPNIELISDGRQVTLNSTPTPPVASQPLRYLSNERVHVPVDAFEQMATQLIESTVTRIVEQSGPGHELPALWEEVKAERDNPQQALYRRLEAMAGADPDEADERQIAELLSSQSVLGDSNLGELAASRVSEAWSLKQLRQWQREVGKPVNRRDRVTLRKSHGARQAATAAWHQGVETARSLRTESILPEGRVSNRRLTELYGTKEQTLSDQPSALYPKLAFELTDKISSVVLRSPSMEGRRFELSRLLGDALMADSEQLVLASRSYTYRQQAQRAFAAELLCPVDSLREFMSDDYSENNIEAAALHFQVSDRLVTNQLINNSV